MYYIKSKNKYDPYYPFRRCKGMYPIKNSLDIHYLVRKVPWVGLRYVLHKEHNKSS